MRLVKIGVAAVSVKVGDFAANTERLSAVIEEARGRGVHLLVTPELGISGYSLEDRIRGRRWRSLPSAVRTSASSWGCPSASAP